MHSDIDKILTKTESVIEIIKCFGYVEPVKIYIEPEIDPEIEYALQLTAIAPETLENPLKMRTFVNLQLSSLLGIDVIFKPSNHIGPLYIEHFNKNSQNLKNKVAIQQRLANVSFACSPLDDTSKRLLQLSEKYLANQKKDNECYADANANRGLNKEPK